jgi:aurora kinase, other
MEIGQDIQSKPFVPSHKPTQSQSISRQNSVSELLTKYAKPHPLFAPSTSTNRVNTQPPTGLPPPSNEANVAANTLDIGRYDGGFEAESAEGRGQAVFGEAAKELALDSSQA